MLAGECPPQVPGIVREEIQARIPRLQPTGEHIDRERKAIHFHE